MSGLLLLTGSPPLQSLRARSYWAYDGCVSLDTSTASTIYNLDQSDPPTCAGTCGDQYQYAAIQAQFCFCFPSPPEIFATYKDSDCSINCDYPYQDESCGGVTSGMLLDVYSYYVGSGMGQPVSSSNAGNGSINTGYPAASQQIASPSDQTDTTVKPTTTDEPSAITPGPTGPVTVEAPSPTGTDETPTQVPSEPSPISSNGPGSPDTVFLGLTTAAAPQSVLAYTITLWTTLTTLTTVYPGGPLQSSVMSLPVVTPWINANFSSTPYSEVTITSTCDEDDSMVTSVLSETAHAVAYDPYVSEVTEVMDVMVDGSDGEEVSMRVVLAAVVPVETTSMGVGRRSVHFAASEGMPAEKETARAKGDGGTLTMAKPGLSTPWAGTEWGVKAAGGQILNASATRSQFPVAVRAAGVRVGWQDSMMVAVVLAVVVGALWL